MSDNNNDFLNSYGKTNAEKPDPEKPDKPAKPEKSVKPEKPAKEIVVKDAPLPAYKYEQKSDFVPPERPYEAPPASPNRKKLIIGISAGVVALIVIIIVLVLLLNSGIEMIDLKGMEYTKAQLWAQDKGVQLESTEEFSDAYAEGVIFEQDVATGERVQKGDFIAVTVSKGHDLSVTLPLPDLKTMTMQEVQAWADENFMTKVRITTEFSDTVPTGNVIRYEVNDDRVTGEEVRRDSPVYVVASKGPEDEAALQVTIPDFKTKTLSECYAFANENGLTLIVDEQYDDYVAAGSIISQSVKAEEKVSRGSEITLVVSKGKKVTVPDFSDYTKEGASAKAAELGIPVTVTERYSGSSVGRFISQSIEAGTVYEAGDILELKYSLGNKVVIASYVGQTLDALQTWAQGLNAQGASIKVNPPTYTSSSSPAGTVLSQSPANKEISYKTTITVTVSSGKVVYVPDFADEGATYNHAILREDAIAMCDALGLVPVFKEATPTISGTWLPGEVWKQDLAAGTETTQGKTITLTYVKSETTGVPSNLIGMNQTDAVNTYGSLLRIVFVEGDTYDPLGTNVVVAQSLTAGSTVAKGTTITLTLGAPIP